MHSTRAYGDGDACGNAGGHPGEALVRAGEQQGCGAAVMRLLEFNPYPYP